MENHENLIGRVFGNRYKIEAIVGEGGMSVVMKARDMKEARDVTIKLLSIKDNAEHNAVERFTNEARAVSMLSHPNIVSVYDVSVAGPQKYIVMEYINGITLKDYLVKKGRLEWREAVHYINQVLNALSYAHENGVIHRDIKPENVMLMRDGSIKVIDFGIAKLPDSKSLTVIDKAIGTVNYISPEQASGNKSDMKSDIYSTGIMLYELVTGQLPFVSSSSVAVAMMHVSSEPAMPSSICESIPKGLEQIIIKSMMKDPERRFGSASAMRKALDYLLVYPNTIFREKVVTGPDGKLITGTGAPGKSTNNTVINSGLGMTENNKNDDPYQGASDYDDDGDLPMDGDDNDDGDDSDDEYSYVKPSRPTMLPIVLGVTVAFFTVAVLFLIFAWKSFGDMFISEEHRDSAADTLTVPHLVDTEYTDELHARLTEMGFDVVVEEVSNEKIATGFIISQDPLGDSTRKKNANGVKLTLEVSGGISEIVLDDYRHHNKEDVELELRRMGLEVRYEYEYTENVIKNHVIKTSPEKGTVVFERDTVTLYISNGPEDIPVNVPDVVGMPFDEAETVMQRLGINVERCNDEQMEFSEEYEEGVVIRTDPAGGESVSVTKDKVTLILSKGPEIPEETIETDVTVGEGDTAGTDAPGTTVPEGTDLPVINDQPNVEEPKVEEPKVEEPKVEEPKVEEPKVEEPKVEEPKVEEPKVEEPKVEEPKAEESEVETSLPVQPSENGTAEAGDNAAAVGTKEDISSLGELADAIIAGQH